MKPQVRTDRRTVLASLVAVTAVGAAGCPVLSSRPPIEDLEVAIFDVRAPSLGARSATVPVVLEVTNPADREVPSPTGEFDVRVNDAETVGADATLPTIEPGETVQETIDVVVDYVSVGESLVSALRTGQFTVHLTGELESEGASRTVDERFDYGG